MTRGPEERRKGPRVVPEVHRPVALLGFSRRSANWWVSRHPPGRTLRGQRRCARPFAEGALDLMPAGRQDAAYAARRQHLRLAELLRAVGWWRPARRDQGADAPRVRFHPHRQPHGSQRHVRHLHRPPAGCSDRLLHPQRPEHRGRTGGGAVGRRASGGIPTSESFRCRCESTTPRSSEPRGRQVRRRAPVQTVSLAPPQYKS